MQAAQRLEDNGPNKLSPPPERPEWLKYLLQYTNPLLFLLIVAGALTLVAYGIQDPKDSSNIILAVVLFGCIFVLATAAYLNERKAGSVAKQLTSMLPAVATVIRDAKPSNISAVDLVVGDLVHLTIGARVPADCKVVVSKDLKLDFSSITGALCLRWDFLCWAPRLVYAESHRSTCAMAQEDQSVRLRPALLEDEPCCAQLEPVRVRSGCAAQPL